jgi:hypothetical protein
MISRGCSNLFFPAAARLDIRVRRAALDAATVEPDKKQ